MLAPNSSNSAHQRPIRSLILASLAAFCAVAFLAGLGVWQLQRLEWKTALLARLRTGIEMPAAVYIPPPGGSENAREFSHVRVKGKFLNADTIRLMTAAPESVRRELHEDFGYVLFTPLQSEGGIVFVNRGFVPLSLADSPALFPKGETEVTGLVRLAAKPSWVTPPPNPAKKLFYSADIPAMAAAAGVKGDKTIDGEYIQAEPLPGAPRWPEARDPKELLASIPNDHLEYAITWFALAAAAAGVFGFYIFRA